MYLSRLILNPRHPATWTGKDRPYEIHRWLVGAFNSPDTDRVLFRWEEDRKGGAHLIVQSLTIPDFTKLADVSARLLRTEGPKEVTLAGIEPGQRLSIRLLCRPGRRVGQKDHVDYGKRVSLRTAREVLEWLKQQGQKHGFECVDAQVTEQEWRDTKGGRTSIVLGSFLLEGIIVVSDPDKLRATVAQGLGPQKGYGFGLVSLARTSVKNGVL